MFLGTWCDEKNVFTSLFIWLYFIEQPVYNNDYQKIVLNADENLRIWPSSRYFECFFFICFDDYLYIKLL